MRNSEYWIVGFLSWFSTEIDIFVNTPKAEFLNVSIDGPVKCCEFYAKLLLMVFNGINFLSGVTLFAHLDNLNLTTQGLISKW